MEPFANKTNLLGGEKYSTIQLGVSTSVLQKYCKKLKIEIEYYFRHVLDSGTESFNPVYLVATFLDPTFSQVLTANQNKIVIEFLKLKIKQEMVKKGVDWRNIIENVGEGENDQTKMMNFRGFKHISNLLASALSSDKAKSTPFSRDLELYRAEIHRLTLCRLTLAKNTAEDECPIDDPLDYWVDNESKYETLLAQIAQDILCIPATSNASERLFSISGLLSSGVMANISPGNLEKRVLTKVNVIPDED